MNPLPTADDALTAIDKRDGVTIARYLKYTRELDRRFIVALAALFEPDLKQGSNSFLDPHKAEFTSRYGRGRPPTNSEIPRWYINFRYRKKNRPDQTRTDLEPIFLANKADEIFQKAIRGIKKQIVGIIADEYNCSERKARAAWDKHGKNKQKK